MQDVPQERSGTDPEPSGKAMSPVRFAGLVFDPGACTLVRESGEAIPLTRGEFRLLRLFVSRSGRVLSRDAILEAVANRPLELFDRSVDALVGRLRRKIEPDPKAPRLIATVPGEGYRFDGFTPALRGALAAGAARSSSQFAGAPAPETAAEAAQAELLAKVEAETAQPSGAPPPPSAAGAQAPMGLWRRLAAGAVLVGALFAAGAYGSGLVSRFMGTLAEDKLAPAPRLSIVVLPFENMSGDKEQDYFADGITDDLTSDLSYLQDSFVISRGTAFAYKGKAVNPKEIGRDLGVRYLMEGSVRRLGDEVEVNARLVSTETGAQVWADRFGGERAKLGELQVEAVSRLANSLGAELVKAEALRAIRERPSNPNAADLAMQARAKFNLPSSKANLNDAVMLSERALALDPQNVRALTVLAESLATRVIAHWSGDPADDMARAEKTADAALAVQPQYSLAHFAKGEIYFTKRQFGPSITENETVIALDPNNANAHALAGFLNLYLGRAEDGFAGVVAAFRLSPRDPSVPWWQFFMCVLHARLAHWEQAIEWCEKSIVGNPELFYPYVDLAAANVWAGHDKEAREAVAQLLKVYPGYTVQKFAGTHYSDDPTFNAQRARIAEGLRKAGLPEE
jgi:TolB-like protein/DNA-binding winged helix-turn-helix (wHTH) protein